jgi:hypothetical protein
MEKRITAALDIIHLANSIITLIRCGNEPDDIKAEFDTIGDIAAKNAAKPEIQGFSEHS